MPTLLLWNYSKSAPLPCVGVDNYTAGRLIGDHVASLGHEKIAAIFPPLHGNDRATRRMNGVVDALEHAGHAIRPEWRLETPYTVASAKAAVTQMMSRDTLPSVIVCGNDVLAWGALHALSRHGVKVPEQMSVTGIGDFNGSKDFEPSLTTVRIPARKIGETAASAIVQLIKSEGRDEVDALVQPELLVRQTSGRPQ